MAFTRLSSVLPIRRGRGNPGAAMSLSGHIYELRRRLVWALLAVAVGTVAGFVWYENAAFGMPTLGTLLTGPYCSLPAGTRVDLASGAGPADGCRLLATGPFDQFLLRLKVGATAGVVLSSPIWLAQLWGFITPGLHAGERRAARWFVGVASVLFMAGAVLAYVVVAQALAFLLSIGSSVQTTALRGEEYFSLIRSMILIFGISLTTPLLVVMLNRVGVVSYARLAGARRGIIIGLFAFAGIATPGGDPISMVVLALTLTALFELAIQVCRFHDRRSAGSKRWETLDDDEPSPLEASTR